MALEVLVIVVSYLLGSVSFSMLFARLFKGIDIRQYGSGNAGATNTLRVLGKGPAVLVLVLDVLKGVAAVWLGTLVGGWDSWPAALCGIAAIIGHNWPLYFHFRGGKGIATTIGVMATLCLWPALLAGVIAILSIVFTRYVSLGSLIFVALTPVALLLTGFAAPVLWASLIIAVFAFWRHRSNIVKIVEGRENKLGSKAKGGERVV
ncbi:glycerol-3-phosphate 1-O-acyltransferase PlsY [Paenibacillus donghaensis]|uniref:Glycerol-3-phosphate acyltransferase n=1 Tax=Paenibacillus donghaensis TaxID=414771 RepID=A0A2Z2KKL7_9BACL|nr:glycerol-3-phosphate 1-O-acyltransferase PlsY [Paenibacillus donghaensis]ASA22939.1 acyl-phosphate glycerol 3-phosphate acyltransferase [Paenibacillus donghaensis]